MTSKAVARVSAAAVAQIDPNYRTPQSADEVLHQIALIDEIKTKVMKEGMHYGTIPGGSKPALFKPGAEKLCLTFKLAHEFDVEVEKVADQHRHYTVNCRLRYRDGTLVGQGVGICSTMETKYRFRSDIIGPVPQEYWVNRDRELIGGRNFTIKKIKKKWMIVQRVEHDNPADFYNTAIKMAKKRAHVDATLSATAASDIFDQDTDDRDHDEDFDPTDGGDRGGDESGPGSDTGAKISTEQVAKIDARITEINTSRPTFLRWLQVETLEALPARDFDRAMKQLDKIAGSTGK